MPKLSPAAHAVLSAVTQRKYSLDPEDIPQLAASIRSGVSIALRAAVDEVAPEKNIEDIDYVHQSYVEGYKDALYEILIIANELEAPND